MAVAGAKGGRRQFSTILRVKGEDRKKTLRYQKTSKENPVSGVSNVRRE